MLDGIIFLAKRLQ